MVELKVKEAFTQLGIEMSPAEWKMALAGQDPKVDGVTVWDITERSRGIRGVVGDDFVVYTFATDDHKVEVMLVKSGEDRSVFR